MTDPRLAPLRIIADLLREQALKDLRAASDACTQSRAHLAALAPTPLAADADPADRRNAMLHQGWADRRRAEINLVLARQTAEWIEARAAAARALGRAEVLRKMSEQSR